MKKLNAARKHCELENSLKWIKSMGNIVITITVEDTLAACKGFDEVWNY